MTRPPIPSDRDLQALLAAAKTIEPVPSSVRARVLSRARQTAASVELSALPAASAQRRPRALVVALVAAAAALVISIAGAVVSLRHAPDTRLPPGAGPIERAATAQPILAPPWQVPELPAPVPSDSAAGAERVAPVKSLPHESYAAELELLHTAQTAYAAHDYASALALLAEHARRFPSGRLAEEREALRVRSLEASGRTEEARRAKAAFASRFPRSVLLTRGIAKPTASE